MFKRLSHPMLYVADLDRAVAFYRESLGFGVSFHHPKAFASLYHAEMACRLDLHPTPTPSEDIGCGPLIYFATEDIDHSLTRLAEMGIKVSPARREGDSPRFATFWDSEGNCLGLEEFR